jgi:hypothetical protein
MDSIFSFLIISFNRAEDTIDAVKNVLQLDNVIDWTKEIIVLNNGSTQDYSVFQNYLDTLSIEERKLVNYINHPKNLGVAAAETYVFAKLKVNTCCLWMTTLKLPTKTLYKKYWICIRSIRMKNWLSLVFLGQNPFSGKI